MATQSPSIFNDVIGPVMRGPSSSHCAASVRIGRLARDLMQGELQEIRIEFDRHGSLATTHESQGSDMGLFGGLLGWDATDERLPASPQAIRAAGVQVQIEIGDFHDPHPNTYRLSLKNAHSQHQMIALSTGGGMIEVVEIDGFPLNLAGDYYETLLCLDAAGEQARQSLVEAGVEWPVVFVQQGERHFLQVKGQAFVPDPVLDDLQARFPVRYVRKLAPVLPVLSRQGLAVPFSTCAEMQAYNQGKNLSLWELALHYESARGGISQAQVFEDMQQVVVLMEKSILLGLQGTEYSDRILHHQSGRFYEQMQAGRLLGGEMINTITAYVTAMMETKSAMGVIVAAPTAGAAGGLPGAVIGAGHALGLSHAQMTRAMLAAGLVGVFIAAQATFAAEVCGCQAETGAGACMAAAALASMGGATADQAVNAAAMALQNVLGLICDPVANRVEVPCLGRNVAAAANALVSANMALAGFDGVVPLDEVIQTMYRVGQSLPRELCCTGLGGLSITLSARQVETRLRQEKNAG